MRIQTNISNDDFEILTNFCDTERISLSALLNALVTDFLECTDKERVAYITNQALKIKVGRPKKNCSQTLLWGGDTDV